MDKRFILFVILAAIILIVTPRIFPPAKRAASSGTAADTAQRAASVESTTANAPGAAPAPTVSEAAPPLAASESTVTAAPPARADTVTVATSRTTYRFSTVGAAPIGIQLNDYEALSGDTGSVQLARPDAPLVSYELVRAPGDTLSMTAVVRNIGCAVPGCGKPQDDLVHAPED